MYIVVVLNPPDHRRKALKGSPSVRTNLVYFVGSKLIPTVQYNEEILIIWMSMEDPLVLNVVL